jgi:ABC-2 type transport system ATP-binding protein
VFISHELFEMEDYCDRIAIVHHGTLRALGTPRELLRQLPAQPTYQLEVEGPAEAVIGALAGLADVGSTSLARGDGTATIEFTIRDGAGNWQPSVWSAVIDAGGRIDAFRQLRGHTLRDVLRHFGSEE